MSDALRKQIGELIAGGRFDEVKKLVSGMLSGDMTEEEKGAVLAGIALAHMEAETRAKSIYCDALADGLEDLKDIDKAEKELEDRSKIDMVRADLK